MPPSLSSLSCFRMLITKTFLSLLFAPWTIAINAQLQARTSARNSVLLKDVGTSNLELAGPSLVPQNDQSDPLGAGPSNVPTESIFPPSTELPPADTADEFPSASPSSNSTVTTPSVAPPTNQNASTTPAATPPNTVAPDIMLPSAGAAARPAQNATTVCKSSSGKLTTFVNQDCLDAARLTAVHGASFWQCGTCVLGLYDADQKKPFKPSGPFNATMLQDQTVQLLAQCTGSSTSHPLKRDTSNSSSNNTAVNVQLLMGYNATSKACPGP